MAYQKLLKQIVIKQAFSIIFMSVVFIGCFYVTESFAWLIFHKPEYKGKIIDADTNEPIEGVVVVALYNTRSIIGGPAGLLYHTIHAKEVLTDKNGEFVIPTYTTMMGPNSKEHRTEFIIYKPGYGRYPIGRPRDYEIVDPDDYFSKTIGTKGETYWGTKEEKGSDGEIYIRRKKFYFTYGIVELRPLNTKEERLRAIPGGPTDIGSKELPLLFKAMNEENRRFGLGEVK